MGIRDQIIKSVEDESQTGFKSETVAVPEWGDVKVTVRELSAGDRRAYWARARRFEEVPGGKFVVLPNDDPLSDIYLVILSTYETDGSGRVFTETDIDELAKGGEKTDAAIERLFTVARRVSSLDKNPDEAVEDAGKAQSTTPTETSSSS